MDECRVAEHRARTDAEVRAYRLREAREEEGLTLVEIAERMHVTQPTVSQLEGAQIDLDRPRRACHELPLLGSLLEGGKHREQRLAGGRRYSPSVR